MLKSVISVSSRVLCGRCVVRVVSSGVLMVMFSV